MNVKKCSNGHYFDSDKYQLCPHCGAAIADEVAPAMQKPPQKKEKKPFWKRKEENRDVAYRSMPTKTMGKTFGLFDEAEKEPPRGTKVVRESSHSVSKDQSARVHRFRDEKADTEDGFFNRNTYNTGESAVKTAEDIDRHCPACGSLISARAKFCKYCGTPLDEQKETEIFENIKSMETEFFEQSAEAKIDLEPVSNIGDRSADEVIVPGMSGHPDNVDLIEEPAPAPRSAERSEPESAHTEPTLQEAVRNAVSGNDGKTVGFFSMGTSGSQEETTVDPVVGWFVCVKGKHLGESFSIFAGRNAIGRGVSNKIILSKDNKVSREKHAWVTYEPKHRLFYVQPGEGSGLIYLNGEMLMESRLLHSRDKIEIGDGLYLLVPLCNDDFSWEEYIG